ALGRQGDRGRVPMAGGRNSLPCIQVGTRTAAEWHRISGAVSRCCLPAPLHQIAMLGADSTPTGLSQGGPVVESCPYEFSFWGRAVEPSGNEPPAVAEVLWLGHDCSLLRADSV